MDHLSLLELCEGNLEGVLLYWVHRVTTQLQLINIIIIIIIINMLHLNFVITTLEEKRLFCLKFPQFFIKIQRVR